MAESSSPIPNLRRKKEQGKNKGNKPAAKTPAPKKSTKTKKQKVDPKKAKCFFFLWEKGTLQEGLQRLPDYAKAKR